MSDLQREIGIALKPILKRLAALERDSHPQVDWDTIANEVSKRVAALVDQGERG